MNDNKLSKLWIAAVVVIPFILMFCLHIGIALGNYFGININVPNVDASTWFLFAGSYLGGVMTLAGVMITLKDGRKIYQHGKVLEEIDKEKEKLGKAICELNVLVPNTVFQWFNSLPIKEKGYDSIEVASVRRSIMEEMGKINKLKLEVMFFTDAYYMTAGCSVCKNPCKIQNILPEFQRIYEMIGQRIFDVLKEIDCYINDIRNNDLRNTLIDAYKIENEKCQKLGQPPQYSEEMIKECENEIVDVKFRQDKICAALNEINGYNQNEIPQLCNLARGYIIERKKNAYKECFSEKWNRKRGK